MNVGANIHLFPSLALRNLQTMLTKRINTWHPEAQVLPQRNGQFQDREKCNIGMFIPQN